MLNKKDTSLAVLSGILLTLAFPPFDLSLLAWVALVPLLLVLEGKNGMQAFSSGMLAGTAFFLGTVYWVFNSMYFYGNVPGYMSVLLVLLLCCYLGLYVGVFGTLFGFLQKNRYLPAALTVPVIWTFLEFARTYVFTGFPWVLLGYSQHSLLPVIQISDMTGVYGVSFLVAALNGTLFDLFCCKGNADGVDKKRAMAGLFISALLLTMSLMYGMKKLAEVHDSSPVRVSIVQGNIEQDKKWDARFQRKVIETYKRLTLDALSSGPELVVWPETALPFVFGNNILTGELKEFQKGMGAHLLFGSVVRKADETVQNGLSNSALLLSPEGEVVSVYDKMHLVPYGEYVPLRQIFPFIDKLTSAIGDFIPGKEAVVMKTPFANIGNLVCYEIIFPGLVRQFVKNGADLLVTITNDAWFGRSSAPYQHFSMAVFRAVENRVPVVRSANTGISGFIDAYGRVIEKGGIFDEDVLTGNVFPGHEKSFYSEKGDLFAWICSAIIILMAAGGFISARRRD